MLILLCTMMLPLLLLLLQNKSLYKYCCVFIPKCTIMKIKQQYTRLRTLFQKETVLCQTDRQADRHTKQTHKHTSISTSVQFKLYYVQHLRILNIQKIARYINLLLTFSAIALLKSQTRTLTYSCTHSKFSAL